ncbi:MFS transporter [Maritimibacter sp. UBA3975]|uniref:MFS transporter n=1 Tax=Maritimibacter sp. UBA3975 TaxID=1946833 RepID=UPI000C08E908|nr:MFS transporter [Maritimibacter sp. UBA3975]MAM60943.1 MFS transporter [Maritimibacter sp.]|tara:strand:+ start:103 stop:1344 length:1242 start_codon:yes stop_codon:yes gene_type:complete
MIKDAYTSLAGEPEYDHEASNGLKHVASLTMTKLADGLINPKLVLAFLLNALGASGAFVSALVPLREAGALLPQVFLAHRLDQMRARRWMWVAGSVGQGVAAAAIAIAALTLEGAAAGWAFVGGVALLALSRAAASVSYKDILGRTVGKRRRGSVTGLAGSVASAGVAVFALLLVLGWLDGTAALAIAVALSAVLWFAAAALFSTLKEAPAEPGQGGEALRPWKVLRSDPVFARFVVARGFLTATALAPPYLVLLSGESDSGLGQLGALVIASAAASFLSSYAWGRFSDRSSRRVLIAAGVLGATAMAAAVGLKLAGLAAAIWAMPVALFVLMIAHHGVRQGRSTYLVDLATDDTRAAYAATANTFIGGLLLISGAFGGALSFIGPAAALTGFGAMALVGAGVAFGLKEAEHG